MPAVAGICETHVYPEIPDELICPYGNNIFRKDRSKYGGRVALLIRNDIIVSEITTSNNYKDTEFCCVDIMLNRDKFRVTLHYRPPHYTSADEQYLDVIMLPFTSDAQHGFTDFFDG